jgi:predicted nuclease of predicted toxin-antitoxin system
LADLPHLIVDENVPSRVREWLTKKGFEITNVNQVHLKGAKDHVVGDFAAKNGLTIITLDNHFSQIYRTLAKDQLTIIIIKAKPATSANIIQILDLAQQKINLKEVKSKLLIVSKNKIRIIT